MRLALALLIGRLVRAVAKLRGGGSAIPGRIAMLIEPKILEKTLGNLKHGVIFVSGSNGKSTTTALVSGTLASQGLKVFSNPSGGNLPQGIASAVVGKTKLSGSLQADVAVLEVDEAYGEIVARHVRPTWVVLTNIQIDQLNRFFEPDRVYGMLFSAAKSATQGVVINASDANLISLAAQLTNQQVFAVKVSDSALKQWPEGALAAPRFDQPVAEPKDAGGAIVVSHDSGVAEISVANQTQKVKLPGNGLHFAIDTALAFSAGFGILQSKFDLAKASLAISKQETVYGRGEIAKYSGTEIQILMMKNPSSMRATLMAMEEPETAIWIAMDEGTPDPSWIYDIDLRQLSEVEMVSGSRCWHWATRLVYAGIFPSQVMVDSKVALEKYVEYLKSKGKRGTLITNYEQMMVIRKHMGFLDLESGK